MYGLCWCVLRMRRWLFEATGKLAPSFSIHSLGWYTMLALVAVRQDLLPLPTYGILQTMAGRRNLFIPVFRKIEGLNLLRSSPG